MRSLLLAAALATLCVSSTASAQTGVEGFAANQLEPSMAGDRFIAVNEGLIHRPFNPKRTALGTLSGFHFLIDYARSPLRATYPSAGGGTEEARILTSQTLVHIGATLPVVKRLALSFNLPIVALQTTDVSDAQHARFGQTQPSKAGLADLRLSARLGILGRTLRCPVALGLQGDVWLPTGSTDDYRGDGRARFLPRLAVSGMVGPVLYGLNVGYLLRRRVDFGHAEIGNALTFGAGVSYFLWNEPYSERYGRGVLNDHYLSFGAELVGNSVVGGDNSFLDRTSSPFELLFHARRATYNKNLGHTLFFAAAGPGIGQAPGVPSFRVVLGFSAGGQQVSGSPLDSDSDGIDDSRDACPQQPGVRSDDPRRNGCPPSDSDHDGVDDSRDACPQQPGPASSNGCPPPPDSDNDGVPDLSDACPQQPGPSTSNGCPPDKDSDGVPDNVDACPDVPGAGNEDPQKNGCPPDKDNDGIVDSKDACPDVAGVADPSPDRNGCPRSATSELLTFAKSIRFQTATATLDASSEPVLASVAALLKEHPEIQLLSIEGHTDNQGNKDNNKRLSQRRADAVKNWLITRGNVDKSRLSSAGFGDEKPVDSNDTDEGRQKNRRVELHVAKLASAPGPGSAQGPKK